MKVYYRTKCNLYGSATLAHTYTAYINNNDKPKITKQYISVFLPRVWSIYKFRQRRGIKHDWDELFSHVISHEYLHVAISKAGKIKDSRKLDNIAGRVPENPFDCGAGMPMVDKKTRKALSKEYPGMV